MSDFFDEVSLITPSCVVVSIDLVCFFLESNLRFEKKMKLRVLQIRFCKCFFSPFDSNVPAFGHLFLLGRIMRED